MLFFPFRADLTHHRIPLVTLGVALLCLAIHYHQWENEEAFYSASQTFCDRQGSAIWRLVIQQVGEKSCSAVLWRLDRAEDPQAEMARLAARGPDLAGFDHTQSTDYRLDIIADHYARYRSAVPVNQTWQLRYRPHSWDPWRMITASFAHADWWHVIGNLIFFLAFAITVETILGSLWMAAVLVILAITTHLFYSLTVLPVVHAPATLGLSGVVMGVMGLFAFLTPRVRVLCFIWFYIGFRIVSIPAWILVLGFSSWDLYDLFSGAAESSNINFVSHVSGAGVGYLVGVLLFHTRRAELPRTTRHPASSYR